MSGRGGRGGRGGSAAGRIVQSLLRDNMEDMGIATTYNGKPADGAFDNNSKLPPPLYPLMSVQTPKPLVDGSDMFAVQKVIDIQYKCEMSPYFLKKCVVMSGDRRRKFAAQQNIRRYSDRYLNNKKESFDVEAAEDCEYDGGNVLKYLETNINNNYLNPIQQQVILNTYFPNELLTEPEKKKKKRIFTPNSNTNGVSGSANANRKRKHIEDEDEEQPSAVTLDVEIVKKFVNAVGNDEEGGSGRKRSRSVGSNAADDADSGDDDTVEDASVGDDDYGMNYYESDNGSDGGDDDGGAY